MKKYQEGLAIVQLMLVLTVIAVVGASLSNKWRVQQFEKQAELAADALVETISLIQAYENDSLQPTNTKLRFPQAMNDLVIGGYAEACSTNDFTALGKCRPIDRTLWGDTISITSYDENLVSTPKVKTHAQLTYPLTAIRDTNQRKRVASMIGRSIPFVEIDASSNNVKIRVNRSGTSVRSDVFIRRNGEDTLTNDWDVGNQAILNVKDITIRNSNGSQRSVAGGVIKSFTGVNLTNVTKHSCPSGFTPNIVTSIRGVFPSIQNNNFTQIGAIKTYAEDRSSYWVIHLDYYARIQDSGDWKLLHDGEIKVDLTCD